MSFLRSLLITDPLVILATVLFGSASLIVSLFDSSGRVQVTIARYWSRVLLVVSGVHVNFQGLEKISRDQSYVFASNHLSFMDTPVVLANIPLQFRFIAKKGLFSIPFLGYHLKRAGHIPVPREDPRGALKAMGTAAQIIKERGISILLFPEGGRSLDGELKSFKEGAAYIAIRAGVPIVPIGLDGTRAVLPMGSLHIRGGAVKMRIGAPISTAGLTLHDRHALTEQVRVEVERLLHDERPS